MLHCRIRCFFNRRFRVKINCGQAFANRKNFHFDYGNPDNIIINRKHKKFNQLKLLLIFAIIICIIFRIEVLTATADNQATNKIDAIVGEIIDKLDLNEIEKIFKRTKFTSDEAIYRFAKKLRKMGIDDKLKELGAEEGDQVRILDFYFDFKD